MYSKISLRSMISDQSSNLSSLQNSTTPRLNLSSKGNGAASLDESQYDDMRSQQSNPKTQMSDTVPCPKEICDSPVCQPKWARREFDEQKCQTTPVELFDSPVLPDQTNQIPLPTKIPSPSSARPTSPSPLSVDSFEEHHSTCSISPSTRVSPVPSPPSLDSIEHYRSNNLSLVVSSPRQDMPPHVAPQRLSPAFGTSFNSTPGTGADTGMPRSDAGKRPPRKRKHKTADIPEYLLVRLNTSLVIHII